MPRGEHQVVTKRHGELAISPAIEQAVTEIKLAAQLALMAPRDEADATQELLDSCEDPIFADEAIFSIKRGKRKDEATGRWVDNYIEGFSIRFAEEFMRVWRHMRSTVTVVLDTEEERTISISVWDCERNASHSDQIHVRKVIERTSAKYRENDILYERLNSDQKPVFGLRATEEETQMLQAQKVSKAIRNLVMRLASSKTKRVCYDRCEATLRKEIENNLPKARTGMLKAFADLKVTREMLENHLGHSFDATTVDEIATLKGVGAAIKAGETSWKEFTAPPIVTDEEGNEKPEPPAKPEPARGRTTRPSQAEHKGKAGQLNLTGDDQEAPDLDVLWREIDTMLETLGDGDMDAATEVGKRIRKALDLPEDGDLDTEQTVRFHRGIKSQMPA